eukprot:1194731-Prorocentrum_minimum.AAC.2
MLSLQGNLAESEECYQEDAALLSRYNPDLFRDVQLMSLEQVDAVRGHLKHLKNRCRLEAKGAWQPTAPPPIARHILSPLLRLVPAAGIFFLPFCDWCPHLTRRISSVDAPPRCRTRSLTPLGLSLTRIAGVVTTRRVRREPAADGGEARGAAAGAPGAAAERRRRAGARRRRARGGGQGRARLPRRRGLRPGAGDYLLSAAWFPPRLAHEPRRTTAEHGDGFRGGVRRACSRTSLSATP